MQAFVYQNYCESLSQAGAQLSLAMNTRSLILSCSPLIGFHLQSLSLWFCLFTKVVMGWDNYSLLCDCPSNRPLGTADLWYQSQNCVHLNTVLLWFANSIYHLVHGPFHGEKHHLGKPQSECTESILPGQEKPFILNYSGKVAINFWPDGINIVT